MSDLLTAIHKSFRGSRAIVLRRILDMCDGHEALAITVEDLARECGYEASSGFRRMLRDLEHERVLLVRPARGRSPKAYAVNADVRAWERAA